MQILSTLIVDDRKEMSVKYKKLLSSYCSCYVKIMSSHQCEFYEYIDRNRPDLIFISDSISFGPEKVCKKIREIILNYRPIVIVLSKSEDIHDKINALDSGADDFWSEPIDSEEFCARTNAHLRRLIEDKSNRITKLPTTEVTIKVINRNILSDGQWAVLLIDIDYLDEYGQIYGNIATNKMLQTYAAIIRASINKEDYLGHLDSTNFVVVTSAIKAEKLSSFIKYAFDTVANKFYTEKDVKRGYITLEGDESIGQRIPIVSTSIGVVTNKYKSYDSYQQVLNELISIHKLAKAQPGSYSLINNPNISAENAIDFSPKNKILIMEEDAALAYLISVTLNMQGYITEAVGSYEAVFEKLDSFYPDLLILDSGVLGEERGFELCKKIKSDDSYAFLKIIMSTIVHDKQKVLKSGADLYLPKPYNIRELLSWVDRFLRY